MSDRGGLGRGVAVLACAVSIVAFLLVLGAGPGTRWGVWGFRTGLSALRMAMYPAGVGALLGLIALGLGPQRGLAAAAIVIAAGAAAPPLLFLRAARAVPAIHDISTDTADPPAFEVVVPARAAAGASNSVDYGGPEIAAQQQAAYPDLKALVLADPPGAALERALRVARELGWAVVDVDPARGRIEATDTTRWFGFKDDVVVRVRPEKTGSRVDVRSLSRVGRSDVGANARRIRLYLQRLQG
jgi:uncharacterized protein (DUF1499 family)